MVIHKYKLVFVHVPKCAGVSITHMLMPHIVGHNTSGEVGHLSGELKEMFELRGKQKHKFGRLYVPDGDIGAKQWRDYFKFAIVRNPWDRVVSEFECRHTLPYGTRLSRKPSTDFTEFLLYCKARVMDWTRRADIYWAHAQPQSAFVTNDRGEIILDEIFRFEDLDRVVDVLKDKTGLPLELPMLNNTPHKKYREYYNGDTREFVRKLYAKDIKMFEYEF